KAVARPRRLPATRRNSPSPARLRLAPQPEPAAGASLPAPTERPTGVPSDEKDLELRSSRLSHYGFRAADGELLSRLGVLGADVSQRRHLSLGRRVGRRRQFTGVRLARFEMLALRRRGF